MGAEDLEWLDRCRHSLRPRHLDLLLSVQHVHLTRTQGRASGHYGVAWDSWTPASQLTGRILNAPHRYDRLVPPAWSCRVCGNLYLLPARCCGREAVEQPLLFYWTILSPYHPAHTEFSLVMLTRNGLPLTQRAVGSILARIPVEQRRDVELIFVDGYSTDGTVEYIRELAKTHPVKLILTHPKEPFVFSRACNRGAHAARGKYLLLLNNDIELRSEEPWGPLRAAFRDPRVGIVGASTFWHPSQRDAEWSAGLLPADAPPYLYVKQPLTGEFWGARREVYWELGGMDETFTGYGHDELDLEYRAQLAHYQLALARVRVHHELHGTFGPIVGSKAMHEMGQENRELFVRKHRQTIHTAGTQVEPFAGHPLPRLSLVMTTRDDGSRLRETLTRAVQDPRCHDGTLQLVVVDNGSTDDTALLLEQYRLRLPRCLSVISVPEPAARDRARQIGQARCIGMAMQSLSPGGWPAIPGPAFERPRAPTAGERRAPAPNRAVPGPAGAGRSAGPGARQTGTAARLRAGPLAQGSAPRPHVFAHSSGAVSVGATAPGSGGFDYPVTRFGSTEHFNVYYQTVLGAAGQRIADGVLRTCERDYCQLADWFGGITPPGLPFNLILVGLSPGRDGTGGAYHHTCAAVDLYEDVRTTPYLDVDLTRMLVVAELVEVFEAAQGQGWDCGASHGEGLSRVLATALYPGELSGYATAAHWLDSAERPDYVNRTAPTDRDPVSNGCAVLFLNWLHDGLGLDWDQIVQAAAPTLAQTCTRLTGRADGWMRFRAAIVDLFPPGSPSGLATDNPFQFAPLPLTARRTSPQPQRDWRRP
jgi:GT2 family glycosyltransferase